MEQTVKCPICGSPYKSYTFSVADQSACPSCVAKAECGTKNQCDGCARGLQEKNGVHRGKGYDMIGCTKHLYT